MKEGVCLPAPGRDFPRDGWQQTGPQSSGELRGAGLRGCRGLGLAEE